MKGKKATNLMVGLIIIGISIACLELPVLRAAYITQRGLNVGLINIITFIFAGFGGIYASHYLNVNSLSWLLRILAYILGYMFSWAIIGIVNFAFPIEETNSGTGGDGVIIIFRFIGWLVIVGTIELIVANMDAKC